NAISFSPEGGTVVVSVAREAGHLEFGVQDEGPGVSFERQATLFSSPHSTRSGGVGIGLPHSRHLAREVGGELRLAPCARGARFELLWPAATAPGPSNMPVQVSATLGGARVLVVEDDPAISALVELSFSARGAEVIVVKDAGEFASVLNGRPVLDLVLLDLSPVDGALSDALDSLEFAAPDAPVVLMSGQPTGVPAEAEGRFAGWVRKPFDMEELVTIVAGL